MIEIRPYAQSDLPEVTTIMNDVIATGEAFVYDRPFSEAEMAAYVAGYSACLVATISGQVVGAYLLRPNQPGRGAHVANGAYMVSLRVKRSGVGRAMGEHSLEQARRMGFAAMQFNAVVSTNVAAVRLWQSLGFEIVATLPRAFRSEAHGYVDLYAMYRSL